MGMTTEGDLYADFLERNNWIDPNITEVITEHQNNLTKLQSELNFVSYCVVHDIAVSYFVTTCSKSEGAEEDAV